MGGGYVLEVVVVGCVEEDDGLDERGVGDEFVGG